MPEPGLEQEVAHWMIESVLKLEHPVDVLASFEQKWEQKWIPEPVPEELHISPLGVKTDVLAQATLCGQAK